MVARPGRKLVATSSSEKPRIEVSTGPLFTLIRATSDFYGGSKLVRDIILYKDYPRVDFETVLDWQGSDVLVTVDFPLAGQVVERTRGIPYGFATLDPRRPTPPIDYYLQADHRQYGYSEAMMPAVRWSDYRFADGSGVALLDRGLTCHEFNPDTITLGLMNAQNRIAYCPMKSCSATAASASSTPSSRMGPLARCRHPAPRVGVQRGRLGAHRRPGGAGGELPRNQSERDRGSRAPRGFGHRSSPGGMGRCGG
jgi:hypothetical protein